MKIKKLSEILNEIEKLLIEIISLVGWIPILIFKEIKRAAEHVRLLKIKQG